MKRIPFQLDKIFYINLDSSNKRRTYMENQLKKLPVPYERFSAIRPLEHEVFEEDGIYYEYLERFRPKSWIKFPECHRRLRGALGCYLSHLEVYKLAREQGLKRFIILEDDVKFNMTSLNIVAKEFHQSVKGKNWDVLRSVWSNRKYNNKFLNTYRPAVKFDREHRYSKHVKDGLVFYGGSHLTLVNGNRLDKIIDYLEDQNIFDFDGMLGTRKLNVYIKSMSIRYGMHGSTIPKNNPKRNKTKINKRRSTPRRFGAGF